MMTNSISMLGFCCLYWISTELKTNRPSRFTLSRYLYSMGKKEVNETVE